MTRASDTSTNLQLIGWIETPYPTPADCPKQPRTEDGPSRIIIDPAYATAAHKLQTGDLIQVLYWFDQADRNVLKTVPRGIETDEAYGVFATRSPNRPNPIALSTAEIIAVNHNIITVSALDCANGTPLLDIKKYVDQLRP